MTRVGTPLRARLSVASRIGAAAVGGYALASAFSALLAVTLPLPRPEAVLAGLLSSFLWYALAVIWVFHARSVARAWIGMAWPTALLGLALWMAAGTGGP